MSLERLVERVPQGQAEEAWLVELGSSASQMQNLLAWKVMYDNIVRLRESFVQKLVAGEDGATEMRKAIVVLDSILKLPAKFIEDGKRARES